MAKNIKTTVNCKFLQNSNHGGTCNLQLWPGKEDFVLLIFHFNNNTFRYDLTRENHTTHDIHVLSFETLSIYGYSNGYLTVSGIWQLQPAKENQCHFVHQCSVGLQLVEVHELFSKEEIALVEHAIFFALQTLEEKLQNDAIMFVGCEEVKPIEDHLQDFLGKTIFLLKVILG